MGKIKYPSKYEKYFDALHVLDKLTRTKEVNRWGYEESRKREEVNMLYEVLAWYEAFYLLLSDEAINQFGDAVKKIKKERHRLSK